MLKEAIEFLTGLGMRALAPQIFGANAEPAHVYYLRQGDSVERIEAARKPALHEVDDMLSLCRLARRWDEQGIGESEFWIGQNEITLTANETRDRASVALFVSPQMHAVREAEGAIVWRDQGAIVRMLRTVFGGALESEATVDLFRRLKWRSSNQGERVVEHGKSSIGRSLEAELTGAGSIPDQIVVSIPVWNRLAIVTRVPLLVEIDASAEKIALVARPGTFTRAILQAQSELAERLAVVAADEIGERVMIYLGSPSRP